MFKIVDVASGAGVGSVGFGTKERGEEQVYEIGWMVVLEFHAAASRWWRPRRRSSSPSRTSRPATTGVLTCA
jgi:hypothetical protein